MIIIFSNFSNLSIKNLDTLYTKDSIYIVNSYIDSINSINGNNGINNNIINSINNNNIYISNTYINNYVNNILLKKIDNNIIDNNIIDNNIYIHQNTTKINVSIKIDVFIPNYYKDYYINTPFTYNIYIFGNSINSKYYIDDNIYLIDISNKKNIIYNIYLINTNIINTNNTSNINFCDDYSVINSVVLINSKIVMNGEKFEIQNKNTNIINNIEYHFIDNNINTKIIFDTYDFFYNCVFTNQTITIDQNKFISHVIFKKCKFIIENNMYISCYNCVFDECIFNNTNEYNNIVFLNSSCSFIDCIYTNTIVLLYSKIDSFLVNNDINNNINKIIIEKSIINNVYILDNIITINNSIIDTANKIVNINNKYDNKYNIVYDECVFNTLNIENQSICLVKSNMNNSVVKNSMIYINDISKMNSTVFDTTVIQSINNTYTQ